MHVAHKHAPFQGSNEELKSRMSLLEKEYEVTTLLYFILSFSLYVCCAGLHLSVS